MTSSSSDNHQQAINMPQQFASSILLPLSPLDHADTLLNVVETLISMNSTGVSCWKDGNFEQAMFLFEKGLAVCGIDVHQLVERNTDGSLLQTYSKDHAIRQTTTTVPIHHSVTSMVQSVSVGRMESTSSLAPPCRDTAYLIFEKAVVLERSSLASIKCSTESGRQALLLIAHHIAPMMLFNAGLLVHQRAVTSAEYYWAHELYRMSLFLMEENTLHGLYSKTFDVLLLALFNNLCELNCSFYQNERVALCREKFLGVFMHANQAVVEPHDYTFFFEQLLYSIDCYSSAAAAAA